MCAPLRASGSLAPSTQLWVVANPNTEADASLLQSKVRGLRPFRGAVALCWNKPTKFFSPWHNNVRAERMAAACTVLPAPYPLHVLMLLRCRPILGPKRSSRSLPLTPPPSTAGGLT